MYGVETTQRFDKSSYYHRSSLALRATVILNRPDTVSPNARSPSVYP
jgi:hypothetical protein